MRNTFKKDSLKKITISLSLLLLCTGCGVGTWQPSREDLSKYGNEEAVYQAKKKRCIEIEDLKIDTESNSPFVDPTTKPIYESISSKEKDECRSFEKYYVQKEGKPFPIMGKMARNELEHKCNNAKYLHMKRPDDHSFDVPKECDLIGKN